MQFLFPFKGWWVVPLKVLFDQTIWSAIWNSIYYVVLGLLRFESPARIWKDLKATFFPLLSVCELSSSPLVPVAMNIRNKRNL
jgi:protein Mpv17